MKNPFNLVHLTLSKSQPRTSTNNINMNRQPVVLTLSRHASNGILLSWASLSPGTPRIASSSTTWCFVAQASHYSIKLRTILTLIYFSLHSQLHFIKHGTCSQPGEESLFTDKSKSTPWGSTCMCVPEDSQSSLPIKCLNFQPIYQLYRWI